VNPKNVKKRKGRKRKREKRGKTKVDADAGSRRDDYEQKARAIERSEKGEGEGQPLSSTTRPPASRETLGTRRGAVGRRTRNARRVRSLGLRAANGRTDGRTDRRTDGRTDRQNEGESHGVRVEPRHDTEDLREPRRLDADGAFLKREKRRGRRRDT